MLRVGDQGADRVISLGHSQPLDHTEVFAQPHTDQNVAGCHADGPRLFARPQNVARVVQPAEGQRDGRRVSRERVSATASEGRCT